MADNRKLVRNSFIGLTGSAAVAAAVLIAPHEGRNLFAYLDPVGIPTICDGVTKGVKLGDVKTNAQCDDLLSLNVLQVQHQVRQLVHVPMRPNVEAAFISFTYNVGAGSFAKSTALRKLNAGDTTGACNELLKWVYAGGKKLRGLELRRKAERDLCVNY